jgi:hypothetical protein
LQKSFNDFISILHIKYFYNGSYPKDRVEEEFHEWFRKVGAYINSLESKIKEMFK